MVLQKPKLRCKYFQWFDEVEADYEYNDNDNGIVEEEKFNESSAGNYVKGFRNEMEHQDGGDNEANMKVLMRLCSEIKRDIKRLEMLLFVVCLGIKVCVLLNLYTLFK